MGKELTKRLLREKTCDTCRFHTFDVEHTEMCNEKEYPYNLPKNRTCEKYKEDKRLKLKYYQETAKGWKLI